MAKKAPRRTAERILEAALDLFNRLGEPNVSTTAIAAHLGISPGNLYYHYPAKEEIVNALSQRHAQDLHGRLQAGDRVRDLPAARAFVQELFECLWACRFLYRDLGELVSRNRALETLLPQMIQDTAQALRQLLQSLHAAQVLSIDAREVGPAADNMAVVLTAWFNYEFVRDPRNAQAPKQTQNTLARGTQQVLHLLASYLQPRERLRLLDRADKEAAGTSATTTGQP
ncbi:MAG: hypothetical protein RL513_957 [Pseudomonadota bacterium]